MWQLFSLITSFASGSPWGPPQVPGSVVLLTVNTNKAMLQGRITFLLLELLPLSGLKFLQTSGLFIGIMNTKTIKVYFHQISKCSCFLPSQIRFWKNSNYLHLPNTHRFLLSIPCLPFPGSQKVVPNLAYCSRLTFQLFKHYLSISIKLFCGHFSKDEKKIRDHLLNEMLAVMRCNEYSKFTESSMIIL